MTTKTPTQTDIRADLYIAQQAEYAACIELTRASINRDRCEMKLKYPDAIALYRVGDFYEAYAEDAVDVSEILGLTLTRRSQANGVITELAGFPHHSLDTYLPKIVRANRRVVIREDFKNMLAPIQRKPED